MIVRAKGDIRPLMLKLGVALAISFAGFIYFRLKTGWMKPSENRPSPRSSDNDNLIDSRERRGVKDDLLALQPPRSSCNFVAENQGDASLPKAAVDNSMVDLSPSSRHREDKKFLLPEFDELVKEFDVASACAGCPPSWKDVETPKAEAEMPRVFRSTNKDDYEQEIRHLRNMVRILSERERSLEIQLLEYYGLKEQETAVMELQNRLKINSVEAKLFTLKIESLQADNRRLEAQVADYAKVVAELEAARAKIKFLKKKLRSDAEQNQEQILMLQKRVAKLVDQEHKVPANNAEVQMKLRRLGNLEDEGNELRKSNMRLQLENSELADRLESTQLLATSVLEDSEAQEWKEQTRQLREENECLAKENERLQADRCADVEELVYLRWINACLRFELRNYQPPPGKTVARDLSKSLSPKSEEKAKQLILEYANTEGMGEKGFDSPDFDSGRWSSSQASYLTDSGEPDETSIDYSSANRTNTSSKMKFFNKLRRLIQGKGSHRLSPASSLDRIASEEPGAAASSCTSPRLRSSLSIGSDGQGNRITSPSQDSSRLSLDIQRSRNNLEDMKDLESNSRKSDVGSPSIYKTLVLGGAATNLSQENQIDQDPNSLQKSELLKYAEVLKDSRGRTRKLHRKSASFSSY
ncbi:protein CHUP1, chloroplastic [Malania oleifera]|uniref:protein CHUP1, chloroplastic n=1 Tax=Malania oleifera TaxID=397392 RepID=UPI0025ADAB97|nr:protein CHUP1, chloroplastic [Malania oleifera]XP_057978216.1 protein CHUP1, chloroplastic [Malania oleifera]